MPGALEADAAFEAGGLGDGVPLVEGERDDQAVQQVQVAGDLCGFAGDAEAVGVFEDQRQEFRGGLAAQDRASVAGGQECGDAADVVEVDVGDDQGLDAGDGEIEGGGLAVGGGVGALFQAAVDQQAVGGVEVELMAGTGDAAGGAVV